MRRRSQVIEVVMTVNSVQHFDAHAQKSRRFPSVSTPARINQVAAVCRLWGRLHSRQGVRRDPARELGQSNSRLKRGLHSLNRSAVPFDEMLARDPFGLPTAQMSQEARWSRYGGLTLLGCASSDRQAIKNSLFRIDE
jgi:hypothetical protein